jgi:hypothetical protein
MAEVWMDEYKRFFYMHRADLKVNRLIRIAATRNLR